METYKRLSAEVIAHLFSRIVYQKNICALLKKKIIHAVSRLLYSMILRASAYAHSIINKLS